MQTIYRKKGNKVTLFLQCHRYAVNQLLLLPFSAFCVLRATPLDDKVYRTFSIDI